MFGFDPRMLCEVSVYVLCVRFGKNRLAQLSGADRHAVTIQSQPQDLGQDAFSPVFQIVESDTYALDTNSALFSGVVSQYSLSVRPSINQR